MSVLTTTFWRARCPHGCGHEERHSGTMAPYIARECPSCGGPGMPGADRWQREERVVYRVGETTYATEGAAVEAGEVWDLPVRRVRVVRLRRVRT